MGVRLFHPHSFSRLAQPGDETFLFCGGFGCFVCGFAWLGFLFGFVFGFDCLIPLFFTQKLWSLQVLVEGHWTYSGTYVLVLQVSLRLLTWTAGILEICCSLRGKKNHFHPSSQY